jgi:hypothetical protein
MRLSDFARFVWRQKAHALVGACSLGSALAAVITYASAPAAVIRCVSPPQYVEVATPFEEVPATDFVLQRVQDGALVRLHDLRKHKPVVLLLSSFT